MTTCSLADVTKIFRRHSTSRCLALICMFVTNWARAESSREKAAREGADQLDPPVVVQTGPGIPFPKDFFSKLRAKFEPIRKAFAQANEECEQSRDGNLTKGKTADAANQQPDSKSKADPCAERDRIYHSLIRGAFGYLNILKRNDPAFRNPETIRAADDIINKTFIIDRQIAEVFKGLLTALSSRHISAEDVVGAFELVKRPEIRERLKQRIESSPWPVPDDVRRLNLDAAADASTFFEAFVQLDQVWRARLTRWLNESDPNSRFKLYKYVSSAKSLRILVRKVPSEDQRAQVALREFANNFVMLLAARTVEGVYVPEYIEQEQWQSQVQSTVNACRAGGRSGCDVVLALCTEFGTGDRDTNRCISTGRSAQNGQTGLRIYGAVRFVNEPPEQTGHSSSGAPLEVLIPLPRSVDESSEVLSFDATQAANVLMERLSSQLDIVGDANLAGNRALVIQVNRPLHSGVSILRKPVCLTHDAQQRILHRGIDISGACRPEFDQAVRDGLRFFASAIEPENGASRDALKLTLSRANGPHDACDGKLSGTTSGAPLYEFQATVTRGGAQKWGEAGFDSASHIGDLYTGYSCEETRSVADVWKPPSSNTGRATSSGWYSAAFAGLPYIQDSRASTWSKIVPSALDGALLVGAGVSFGLSVKYRNDFAENKTDSLGPATAALNTGIALGLILLGNRIISGLGYEYAGSVWKKEN